VNLRILSACYVTIFICIVMVQGAFAQTVVPGVSSGDFFVYNIKCFWSSSDPNATCPPFLIEINETEWFRVNIVSVGDTYVIYQHTFRFKNGTEYQSGDCRTCLDSGTTTGEYYPFFLIIAANLSSKDKVYPAASNSPIINETIIREYGSYRRETNHVIGNVTTGDIEHDLLNLFFDIYFDRPTGVCVESYWKADRVIYDTEGSYLIYQSEIYQSTIVDSNVWIVPEFPSFLILLAFMIATLQAAVIYKKLRLTITF